MEESNLINNDNTLNKDDLQEVTGSGDGAITTPVVSEDNNIEQQASGTLTPILGDGTPTPDADEEPVLLEKESETIYKAVINSDYKYNIPAITFGSKASSWCNANYVIAVTESDENTPISYDSQNLSTTFTNDGDKWCSVEFKNPLNTTLKDQFNLTSTNFPDNSKIIVPVISCDENTGTERNTVITFNIKNFTISHNIHLSVTQNAYSG